MLWARWFRRYTSTGAVRLADAIPVHSKWWRDAAKHDGDLTYLVVGDSTAQGIGASRPDRGYVGMLARHIRSSSGRDVRVVNLSQSGARVREILEVMLPRLSNYEADVVTVSIGANDIAEFDLERFTRELDALYSVLPSHAIVGEVPSFYFGDAERRVRIANRIVRETADRYGLVVAPVYAATRRQTGARYALNQVAADFFHPNDRGYRVWATAFEPLVDARLAALAADVAGAADAAASAPAP